MHITTDYKDKTGAILALFSDTFTASEGAEAGAVIGQLVQDMLAALPPEDMSVFSAVEDGAVLGCVLFTRMTYPEDGRTVFILSPAAVATGHQGRGLGQRLITGALEVLRQAGVEIVLTYGDIAFYGRVGFAPITEAQARPPQPLSYPEGWLGRALPDGAFAPLAGPSRCVPPLEDPAHW
ncbi:GNAT family N-acetyltransferase [Pacificoceanicola onchidii]|uniref:GNAT family N-acetyltransferase n=1 Tax=Pacificoceanicola onchidii TaxID=2562685 RepID=UPI0010A62213|nr:N-acetyltransferase [Pacificoceanicola onchidii]